MLPKTSVPRRGVQDRCTQDRCAQEKPHLCHPPVPGIQVFPVLGRPPSWLVSSLLQHPSGIPHAATCDPGSSTEEVG